MSTYAALAQALRDGRRARGMTIAGLAERAGVSPRLVSEVERGRRPHVSLETALHLLRLVGADVSVERGDVPDDVAARRERAAHRRRSWQGWLGTLADQAEAEPPEAPETRVGAVAQASELVVGLQRAFGRVSEGLGSGAAIRDADRPADANGT